MGRVWRGTEIDPACDPAAAEVLAAYDAADRANRGAVECYCAGVAAWRRAHPDQTPAYAARQAVAVILAARVSLRAG
jgi:hypothetical protein